MEEYFYLDCHYLVSMMLSLVTRNSERYSFLLYNVANCDVLSLEEINISFFNIRGVFIMYLATTLHE